MKTILSLLTALIFIADVFSQVPESWEGKVMTVNGLISADSMGITLPHEHLLIEHTYEFLNLTNEEDAISELGYFVDAGGKTLIEASVIGVGRNPEGLKRISDATGANVIMSAGYYKDQWVHDSLKSKSVEQLTEIIINDIKYGINGIHAGSIKIAMSRLFSPFEEKVLIAAARAQVATGAALNVHFDMHRATTHDRHYVLDVFENEGVDLKRVFLSHCVPYVDLVDDYISLLQRGCYLSFDMIGSEVVIYFERRLEIKLTETIIALIDAGYLEQILISQDLCFTSCYVKNGGYGYAHILNDIVPLLNGSGITDEQIHTMMVESPQRLFPFNNSANTGRCVNSTYTATTGTISDNSGSKDYSNDLCCSKLIQPLNCNTVVITFTEFSTELSNDVLTVYDGPTTLSPILGQFSGSNLPPILESTTGSMLVVFNTNGSNTNSGWKANYYGKVNSDYAGPCLNEVFMGESGTISDNSGDFNYSYYLSCQKLINVPGSTGISLQFNSFATEAGYDFVRVYDGPTISSPILGEYSGTVSPPVLKSSGGSMLILFFTNGSVQTMGWNANYSSKMLGVTPASRSMSSSVGTTTFSVTSNVDWSVNESSDWFTATRTDNNTLTVTCDENISVSPRSAEIEVIGSGVISQYIVVNQNGASPVLNVTPASRSMSSSVGTTTFSVTSNIDWSVNESSDWFTATRTDNATLTVTCDENISVNSRSAEIEVIGSGVISQYIVVNQNGASPVLNVTPESRDMSSSPGTTIFTVTSNVDWSVNESSDWLTATRTDDSTLTVTCDENISVNPRSAEIEVIGPGVISQYVSVNQTGANPVLNVTPESSDMSSSHGTTIFAVTSNVNWSVSENSDWLTATRTDDSTLTVTCDENISVISRSAEIEVTGPGATSKFISVNQTGASPVLNVTPESRSMSSSAGTTTFMVTSNFDWVASESIDWLTATRTNDTTLTVSFDENINKELRFAEIIVSGPDMKFQSVFVIQEGAYVSRIKDWDKPQHVNVFPNPVSDKVYLDYPMGIWECFIIYEPTGKPVIIMQGTAFNNEIGIDLSGLNSGLYLYRLIDKEGNIYNGKILKK